MRNAIEHIDGRINTIGKRIKYFRVWLKETQEAFAPRMGVAKPTLVSYEHDNSRPDITTLPILKTTTGHIPHTNNTAPPLTT